MKTIFLASLRLCIFALILTARAQTTLSGSGSISGFGSISLGQYPPPIASFTFSPSSSIAPGTSVTFTDTSSVSAASAPHSYSWTCINTFTGGTEFTSSSQNPSHTFSSGGTYTVTETVSDLGGSSSAQATVQIAVTVHMYVTTDATTAGQPVVIADLNTETHALTGGANGAWSQGTNGEAPCAIYPIVGYGTGWAPPTPLYYNGSVTTPTPTGSWQVRYAGTAVGLTTPNGGTNGANLWTFAADVTNLSMAFWFEPSTVVGAGDQYDFGQQDTPTGGDTDSISYNFRDNDPYAFGVEGAISTASWFGTKVTATFGQRYWVEIQRLADASAVIYFYTPNNGSSLLTLTGSSSISLTNNEPVSVLRWGEDNTYIGSVGTNIMGMILINTNGTLPLH